MRHARRRLFPTGSPINACSRARQDMDTQSDEPVMSLRTWTQLVKAVTKI